MYGSRSASQCHLHGMAYGSTHVKIEVDTMIACRDSAVVVVVVMFLVALVAIRYRYCADKLASSTH